MIEKSEIIKMATKLSLNPDTVEKDYVLSWLLWGINNHPDFSTAWLFKGGTCLKKCFFETFRFSEDLDFTVTDSAHLSPDFLKEKFHEITDSIYNETGIEFFKENFKFKVLPKENDKLSAQGTIHYNGPLRRKQTPAPSFASIKLDLTNNEIIALQSERKKVHHPYSDEPINGIWSTCYAFEEVIAEKIRALGERARPRDLYDVVHFFRNRGIIKNTQLIYDTLAKKCAFKKIAIPTYFDITNHQKLDELHAQWDNMLAHQLPSLPPLETFWNDLEPFFDWINGDLKENVLTRQKTTNEKIFHPGRLKSVDSINAVIQKIQFAAANRVCIEINYSNKSRIIEPLSFRISKEKNQLLYGYEHGSPDPNAFTISKIQTIAITNIPYHERQYPIEINASNQPVMPPIRRKK